ncbi:MAG: hypothetical protein QNJ07_09465 [Woeseiaceae bacterium]|nr:hypothetical protein [Woeseiaceae bacterium]
MKSLFEDFIQEVQEMVNSDEQFIGLAISGSWVSDEVDEFSDLDLLIVCQPGRLPIAPEMRVFAESIGGLVSSFTGEHVGEPSMLICLYQLDRLVHVDFKFSTTEELRHRPYDSVIVWERDKSLTNTFASSDPTPISPEPQWIEDRFWTWIHYAALRLGRSELHDLVNFLGFIREMVLGPLALHAEGFPPFGVRKIERCLPEFASELQKAVASYDVESCFRATLSSIEIYRRLRVAYLDQIFANELAETASIGYLRDVAFRIHGLR